VIGKGQIKGCLDLSSFLKPQRTETSIPIRNANLRDSSG